MMGSVYIGDVMGISTLVPNRYQSSENLTGPVFQKDSQHCSRDGKLIVFSSAAKC